MRSSFERIYTDDEDYYLIIQMCPCCKYVYKEKRSNSIWDAEIIEGDKPFIELLEKGLYENDSEDIKRITQYICPKCGIIQADIGDIE